MISFQTKPWVAFVFPYLLIELFYIGMPVVRTDGRTVTWLPNFLGWVDYHISLAMGLRPRARFARRWSSAIKEKHFQYPCHSIKVEAAYKVFETVCTVDFRTTVQKVAIKSINVASLFSRSRLWSAASKILQSESPVCAYRRIYMYMRLSMDASIDRATINSTIYKCYVNTSLTHGSEW